MSAIGLFKILEVNARPWWYVEFAASCGVDVCEMARLDALGEDVPAVREYPAGRLCVYPRLDYKTLRLPSGGDGPWRVVRSWFGADQLTLRSDDPAPGIQELYRWGDLESSPDSPCEGAGGVPCSSAVRFPSMERARAPFRGGRDLSDAGIPRSALRSGRRDVSGSWQWRKATSCSAGSRSTSAVRAPGAYVSPPPPPLLQRDRAAPLRDPIPLAAHGAAERNPRIAGGRPVAPGLRPHRPALPQPPHRRARAPGPGLDAPAPTTVMSCR